MTETCLQCLQSAYLLNIRGLISGAIDVLVQIFSKSRVALGALGIVFAVF